ncbi:protein kinase [Nonomuraea sp. M3C6]|uniref:non-specific serine/threonine protein kinase n=1 Tax=Nonomuraea marmarensis TaxID=3351344 RepID=A0ABW7AIR1_9ACTN
MGRHRQNPKGGSADSAASRSRRSPPRKLDGACRTAAGGRSGGGRGIPSARPVGRGQGTVYLGQAPDGRPVAVKVLRHSAGFDDRFAKEIAAARRVEPFCIAQVLDASLGRQPYIVTEYVEGPSLQQAGRHTGADLQRLAVATATALAAIHQAGVVHRDFKPANVLLGPGGPRVIDFGIARAMDDAVTHTSGIVGTPAYMAPEQLAGQGVGAPADVFAWASVMVWAANETPPFGQDTLPAIINRILHNEPQLGDLPHPLRSIVYDCLAKDPRARPTMRDVLLRLLSGQNAQPPMSAPGAAPGQGQGWSGPGPGPTPGLWPGPTPMAGPGPAPMAGPGLGPGPMPGPMAGGRKRSGIPTAVAVSVGVSGVVVAALVGGVVWLAPWSTRPDSSLAAASPSPSAQLTTGPETTRPETTTPKTTRPPRKSTRKPTSTPTSKATPKTTPSSERPTPTRTTKKPVTVAKVSILAIELSGGPGQADADGCYMPPLHFQTRVESSRPGIWLSYAWDVDGKTVDGSRIWVPRDDYTAFVTSGQYMLKAGTHTVTLRVTSPSTARKSVSVNVCALETW